MQTGSHRILRFLLLILLLAYQYSAHRIYDEYLVQGGEDPWDVLSRTTLFAKEPLITWFSFSENDL